MLESQPSATQFKMARLSPVLAGAFFLVVLIFDGMLNSLWSADSDAPWIRMLCKLVVFYPIMAIRVAELIALLFGLLTLAIYKAQSQREKDLATQIVIPVAIVFLALGSFMAVFPSQGTPIVCGYVR